MNIIDKNLQQNAYELKNIGYLRINNFLEDDFAERIHNCLINDVDWGLTCIVDGISEVFLKTEDVDQLDLSIIDQINNLQKEDKFQFIYNTYMMVTAYIEKRNPELYLNKVLEWLNSAATLSYFKDLTKNNKILKFNVQATRYLPGHYLTQHSDIHSGEGRLYACVIGLTKNWNPDWGGLLHILDKDGNIVKTMTPKFNSLSIFKVPQNHFVSMVTPRAQSQRLAITGWLQAK